MNLEAMYAVLAEVARRHQNLTYSEPSQSYFQRTEEWHEPHGTWDDPLGELNHMLHELGWPPLSAKYSEPWHSIAPILRPSAAFANDVVVLDATGEPGGGFWASCPNIPARPKDSLARTTRYSQILNEVHDANWPSRPGRCSSR